MLPNSCLLPPPWNRDTDQVHPRAVWHGPRGATHASREQWLQDPHDQPGLCGSVVVAIGVWGPEVWGGWRTEGTSPEAQG